MFSENKNSQKVRWGCSKYGWLCHSCMYVYQNSVVKNRPGWIPPGIAIEWSWQMLLVLWQGTFISWCCCGWREINLFMGVNRKPFISMHSCLMIRHGIAVRRCHLTSLSLSFPLSFHEVLRFFIKLLQLLLLAFRSTKNNPLVHIQVACVAWYN